jgi:fermentation-respiration switch protein FrsA (DUF1100 family)
LLTLSQNFLTHENICQKVPALRVFINYTSLGHFQLTYFGETSPRPVLVITDEMAHSRYVGEDAYKAGGKPKGPVFVPGAEHVDLNDHMNEVPFYRLDTLFKSNLR